MPRRIFIGDIQGCLPALEALLDRLALRSDDRLWCVGDLVNRGPDSLGVLRRLYGLDARAVLGNHDIYLLQVATCRDAPAPPCLGDVLAAPDRDELLTWLAQQPVMQVDADVVLVHGGLHPGWVDLPGIAAELNHTLPSFIDGVPDARIEFAITVRHCTADGQRPAVDDPPPGPPFEPWDHWYRGGRTAVFGHWARRGLVVGPRTRGLDTGCVYGGKLTAWIAEADRFVQVAGWNGARGR